MSNEQRKTTDYQIKKASEYNKAHYIQVALRLSPEDAETVAKIATETRQSKNAVITTAIHLYAQSLTAAETPTPGTATPGTPSPAPEEISPRSITGAETQHTEMPGEDQQGKPQGKPQDAHSKPQDASKQGASPNPEEIAEEIKAAYLKGYRQARQEIKAEIKATRQAAQQAQHIRHTAQRARVLTQARRRPKAYKG